MGLLNNRIFREFEICNSLILKKTRIQKKIINLAIIQQSQNGKSLYSPQH
jgi:hypothetical protein